MAIPDSEQFLVQLWKDIREFDAGLYTPDTAIRDSDEPRVRASKFLQRLYAYRMSCDRTRTEAALELRFTTKRDENAYLRAAGHLTRCHALYGIIDSIFWFLANEEMQAWDDERPPGIRQDSTLVLRSLDSQDKLRSRLNGLLRDLTGGQ